jgi:hypothetical protein
MNRMQWSPEYQEQQLHEQLAQLQEQEGWWTQEVTRRRQALKLARRALRDCLRQQEGVQQLLAIGFPLFEPLRQDLPTLPTT